MLIWITASVRLRLQRWSLHAIAEHVLVADIEDRDEGFSFVTEAW